MLYPMAALVLLTFFVALMMLKARIQAVHNKDVSIKYFKSYDQPARELPERMVITQRCYNNLLEIPPLFYAVCLAALALHSTGVIMAVLAWLYVACRVVQAAIHLGRNNVIWRMRVFLLSNLVLLAMWTYMVIAYAAR
ncbi:MAPEG family protein [Gilvimarinus sp. SDUM040013]|uniref:MAPEG family protein n=1 Tax=Gilvimarinus gilvus TaxID=3058038 RepID=A0ABU4RTG5_9GAMM|nr:MAPEG family protein [Gilvimarinus sp. SDUM040013]MDO3386933.1 MAPEG family protein [Gilvimarinus sp. SDUM040013]MDX6848173.1 MAPEG family protein [Gilvimarinus sp. SDUM040013]